MKIILSAILAQKYSRKSRKHQMNVFVPEMIWEQPFLLHLLLLERTDIESNVRFHFHSLLKAQFFRCYQKDLILFLFSRETSFGAGFCPTLLLYQLIKAHKLQVFSWECSVKR
jgi:hypothetical protein